jgi:3-hydroxyisobutyrate dehydrogenase-like beta-hydroxyacid dehydrogenase
VDANAISPARAVRIGERLAASGAAFVDGGIIGGPAWQRGTTWLCLSGAAATRVAACFEGGPLEIEVLDGPVGRASALKMCYAAYTKGTTALLGAIMGAAENLGVREPLYGHWARNGASFIPQSEKRVTEAALKAWRWVGEMEEISATLEQAGMPEGFHLAAAEFYRHLSGFKGGQVAPAIDSVLGALPRSADRKPA